MKINEVKIECFTFHLGFCVTFLRSTTLHFEFSKSYLCKAPLLNWCLMKRKRIKTDHIRFNAEIRNRIKCFLHHESFYFQWSSMLCVYGDFTLKLTIPVRSRKLKNIEPRKYLDRWPIGTTRCFKIGGVCGVVDNSILSLFLR